MGTHLMTRLKGLPRWQKFSLAAVLAILLYTLIGFLVLPPVVRMAAVSQLSKQLQREVRIEAVRLNPYTLSATIRNLAVMEPDGQNRLVAFRELFVNLQSLSLFKWAPIFREVRLDGFYAFLALRRDKRWNFSDLLPDPAPESETPAATDLAAESDPFRFSLNNIQLTDSEIHFQDDIRGKTHHVTGIDFAVPFLSNLPAQVDVFVQPHFDATINGTPFNLQGQVKPFAGSRETELIVDLQGIDLAAYMPYVPPEAGIRIASGLLDVKFSLVYEDFEDGSQAFHSAGTIILRALSLTDAEAGPLLDLDRLQLDIGALEPLTGIVRIQEIALQGPSFTFTRRLAEGAAPAGEALPPREIFRRINLPPPVVKIVKITLEDGRLRIRDRKSPPTGGGDDESREHTILALPAFAVEQTEIDIDRQSVRIAALTGREGVLEIRRLADGALNLDAFQTSAGEGAAPPETPAPGEPWQIDVAKLNLADYAVNGRHLVPDDPVEVAVDAIDVELTNFSTRPGAETTLALNARINRTGHFETRTTMVLQPLSADARLSLEQLDLVAFFPFFKPHLGVILADGDLAFDGELTLRTGDDGAPAVVYKGGAAIRDLRTLDRQGRKPFVTWQALNLSGVDVGVNPTYLTIDEIRVTQPFSRLLIDEKGRLNLAMATVLSPENAAGPEAEAPPAATGEAEESPPVPITIGSLEGRGGKLIFIDRSFQPGFEATIEAVETSITGLSSEGAQPARVAIRGEVDGHAPVTISGEIQPLKGEMFADLAFDFQQVDLTAASPYSGRYVGRTINQGKLSVKTSYHIEDGALKADHDIRIDQFNFGQSVESPDDLGLPVDLAVALLKDRRGEIHIDLPVSGNMDDPQFSIGGIVLRAFVNLIVKAATSPFALLGGMFESEDLNHLAFEPGRTRITPETAEKLEALIGILYDRPALRMEVAGYAHPASDAPALIELIFQRKLKAQKALQLEKEGQAQVPLDDIVVSPEEYEDLLQAAYEAETFEKPENFIGMEKTLPPEEAEALIREHMAVGQVELEDLAYARARIVRDYLGNSEKVDAERVFLVKPANTLAPEVAEGLSPECVLLGLK